MRRQSGASTARTVAITWISNQQVSLYARAGFTFCGPFAEDIEDPNSVFMKKGL